MKQTGEHNGWVIVGPSSIVGENPRNYHVIEVKIVRDANEQITSVVRDGHALTLCTKCSIKDGTQKSFFTTGDENAMRGRLSQMQNDGLKICGICASRFYADDDYK